MLREISPMESREIFWKSHVSKRRRSEVYDHNRDVDFSLKMLSSLTSPRYHLPSSNVIPMLVVSSRNTFYALFLNRLGWEGCVVTHFLKVVSFCLWAPNWRFQVRNFTLRSCLLQGASPTSLCSFRYRFFTHDNKKKELWHDSDSVVSSLFCWNMK